MTILLGVIFLVSCGDKRYEQLVERELARNVRYDSLFLGLHLGMGSKDFFASCWEMNKQGHIKQGPNNLSVQYDIGDPFFKSTVHMHFYPDFHERKIYKMPLEFNYEGWAIWNKELAIDTLLMETKQLLENWYGDGFIELENEDKTKKVWVKVDGNRRIRLFKKDVRIIRAEIVDLTILPAALESKKKEKESS